MDNRNLFFAMTDRDFFDVPWALDCTDPVAVDERFVAGWTRRDHGPWSLLLPPGLSLPGAGWKIHVGSRPEDAAETVAQVAQACHAEGAAWKLTRSTAWARAAEDKCAPLTLSGKLCVVYCHDDEQLVRVLRGLAERLRGRPGPRAQGDHHHPAAPIGLRWGSYEERWVEAPDGRTVPGVQDGARVVADPRGQVAPRPLPDAALALLREDSTPAPQLPVTAVRLLHRSSAGSVYDATLTDGRRVAIKEARRDAGFDGDGVDAVTRLRHEHAVLRRLAGHGVAPAPVAYWEHPASELLVMGWVGDGSMIARISRDHPRGRPELDAQASARFWSWAEEAVERLAALVDGMHGLGVAHGDLHPGNVVLGPDGPRLVDFEAASLDGVPITRGVGTPGFVVDDPDPYARDRFALDRTRACLHHPGVALVDRRPDLATLLVPGSAPRSLPDVPDSTSALLDRLADDTLARATPARADRLFCGGIEQFTRPLGGHDLLSGAAGVLLALQSHGRSPDPRHLDWLADVPSDRSRQCRGLAEGGEGIALALALLGRPEQASVMIDGCADALPQGLSWARGRAGCAVALLELADLLGRDDLYDRGVEAALSVAASTADRPATVGAPGLLEGWAGVALALLRAGELATDLAATTADAAARAVAREIGDLRLIGDALVSCRAGRSRIGLGHGSAALVLAVRALEAATGQTVPGTALAAAEAALRPWGRTSPPTPGLIEGQTGGSLVLRASGRDDEADGLDAEAAMSCVPTSRGWSALGAQALRCSDDLMSGSAGLVVGLGPGGPTRSAHVLRLPRLGPRPDDTCHARSLRRITDMPDASVLQ
ncbi:phosphotransferase [Luteipulveratus sp. YIM 133132]|uniref:class III lanthionine synthetase LanKC N-terminal domain-containing protein n=1 Tax=Luteipulveratus flavus TaxID=3031728 RepID=UPI0023B0D8BC|nr:lanthionine synthetase LanC family protein [Luteipulveratus sp. YIM 133132]MDE9364922.1 phosphotransferase [Luteipulveratus sp. YIM 133132]